MCNWFTLQYQDMGNIVAKMKRYPVGSGSVIRWFSLYHKSVLLILSGILILFSIYTYAQLDPNITLMNNALWARVRDLFIQLGYFERPLSSFLFVSGIVALVMFHRYAVKHQRYISLPLIVFLIALTGILTYPFLSHDFFNYMFDARIATWYHQSPYLHKALDYPADEWIRFMHWTHRTYPYGPVYIAVSLIPSFLGFGKFLPTFLLFKGMNVLFYAVAAILLAKLNRRWAVLFATHPLVIVEGLWNGHNDMIALCLAIAGIYFLLQKKKISWGVLTVLSIGIKYMTLPYAALFIKGKAGKILALLGIIAVLGYMSFFTEIQAWYFLALLALIPFFEEIIVHCEWFFMGLLLAYYPFIREGNWGLSEVMTKHIIMACGFFLTLIYFAMRRNFFLRMFKQI